MAKQTGVIKLKGTIGDINFYNREGENLARKAGGGFNGEHIKTKESMARVRENAGEFGHCSAVKKQFKRSLNPFLCVRKDGKLHGRMMSMFMRLRGFDRIHERGKRKVWAGVATPMGGQLLRSFELTPDCDVFTTLGANGIYDAGTRTYSVSDFEVKRVAFPKGATHLALTLGLLHFNFESLAYELKTSAPLYIDTGFVDNSFALTVAKPTLAGFEMAVLGVKFYQELEGQFYIFKSARAVGVAVVG